MEAQDWRYLKVRVNVLSTSESSNFYFFVNSTLERSIHRSFDTWQINYLIVWHLKAQVNTHSTIERQINRSFDSWNLQYLIYWHSKSHENAHPTSENSTLWSFDTWMLLSQILWTWKKFFCCDFLQLTLIKNKNLIPREKNYSIISTNQVNIHSYSK